MINAIRMNHGYSGQGLHVDEEPNVDATIFFKLLKYINHYGLSA